MPMHTYGKADKTTIKLNDSYEGETIEQKVRRIFNNKEPISDNAPLIYTERKQGVQPDYNVRTDRFEEACDAMDKVTKSHLAKRAERHKEPPKKEDQKPTADSKSDTTTAPEGKA